MRDSEFLAAPDVRALSGQTKPEAQAQALKAEGIPNKLKGKRVFVSKYHVRLWLEGRPVSPTVRPDIAAAAR